MATGNAKGHYWQQKVLNAALTAVNITAPATIYLALFTANPTDNGGGTEVSSSGTAYGRQSITFAAAVSGGASPGSTSTSNEAVSFAVATANYGTVTGWALFDASTGGNMLYWGSWNTPQAVNSGNQFTVPSGSLVIGEY